MRYVEEVNRIVRSKWKSNNWVWKVVLVVGIIVAVVVGLVALLIWLFGKLLGSLSIGKVRNLGLYYPAKRRSR